MINKLSFGAYASGNVTCSNFTIPGVTCKINQATVSGVLFKSPLPLSGENRPSEAQAGDILVGSFNNVDGKKDIYCVTSRGGGYMDVLNLSALSNANNPYEAIDKCKTHDRISSFDGVRLLKTDVSISDK